MTDDFQTTYTMILRELANSLAEIKSKEINTVMQALLNVNQIFVTGAGRMGIMLSAFSMRLNHLGIPAFIAGDTNCPPISKNDLLLVASSSGETPTIREIVKKAVGMQAEIIAITAEPGSSIAQMSRSILCIEAPSALESSDSSALISKQPMKTLFEQTLFIILETLVFMIMAETGQSASDLVKRHANLE